MKKIVLSALVASLAACGGGGGGFGSSSSSLLGLSGATSGSFDPAAYNAALSLLNPTEIANLPTGSATYRGFYNGVDTANPFSGPGVGEAQVNVDFAADTGTLNLSGVINTSLSGSLTGNQITGTSGTNSWDGDISGPNGEVMMGNFTLNENDPTNEVMGVFITER